MERNLLELLDEWRNLCSYVDALAKACIKAHRVTPDAFTLSAMERERMDKEIELLQLESEMRRRNLYIFLGD